MKLGAKLLLLLCFATSTFLAFFLSSQQDSTSCYLCRTYRLRSRREWKLTGGNHSATNATLHRAMYTVKAATYAKFSNNANATSEKHVAISTPPSKHTTDINATTTQQYTAYTSEKHVANSTPTSKRCNSRPSKGLRDLEMLHKFLSKKDYRERELNKQFPSANPEKGWLVFRNVNIKNRDGTGHYNIHKRANRSNCTMLKRNSYTWDPHAKECMMVVPVEGRMLSLFEIGRVSSCKLGSNDCNLYVKALGSMFKRFDGYARDCEEIVKNGKISTQYPDHRKLPSDEHPPRVIVSLTTIPSRFQNAEGIVYTIRSVVFGQIMQPDCVWIAVPKISRRFKKPYPATSNLLKKIEHESHGRFAILPCEDFGPATKLIPALKSARPNDIVITIDDDSIYMPWAIGNLVKHSVRANSNAILAHLGYDLKPNGVPRHPNFKYIPYQYEAKTLTQAQFIAGLAGVLYKRKYFFNSELTDIFLNSSSSIRNISGEQQWGYVKFNSFLEAAMEVDDFKNGRFVDDDYISGIASTMKVPCFVVPATVDVGFGIVWHQVTEANALSSGTNKHKNIERQFRLISNFKKFGLLPLSCGSTAHLGNGVNRSRNGLVNLMQEWHKNHACV